ncbi:MAG: nuclear transport factor 2 family protein, partial [Thermoleophilia bacterium]|nr:nuclear transport factor 2 family protein [Thermoleophilia bacterium]
MTMTLEELEREVTRLEDIQAIKDLQCKYGYYMDSHHRQEVYDLFSDDTESVEIESTGLFLGKKGVGKFFLDNDLLEPGQTETPGWINILIIMDQPVIEVDPSGTTATGRWTTWLAEAMNVGGIPRQQWVQGYYENEYVKENGKW